MATTSIRIEGGLLGPDTLEALPEFAGQKPVDFGLEPRRNLTDEIAAVFAEARNAWTAFKRRLDRISLDDPATTETRKWLGNFLGLLGYDVQLNPRAVEVDGVSLPVSHRAGEAELSPPLHLVGARQPLGRVPISGKPRLAPHSLLQEYLNRTEHVWGIVSNGLDLRLLRDCSFIRRQAYIEFDLREILEEQRFPDFGVLYRVLHRTRLPKGRDDAADCLLERYHTQAIQQGGRVRDGLRDGVQKALEILGAGFLKHPANQALRDSIADKGPERITAANFYRQLLRLVYRLLFLLVSEDRGLLGGKLYRGHYGAARLRRLAECPEAHTQHGDLWESLRLLQLLLSRTDNQIEGKPLASLLSLPVLNGALFDWQILDGAALRNNHLLQAVFHLGWYKEKPNDPWRKVNYAALDVEELGSVYESLLDFHPVLEADQRGFYSFELRPGSDRKTTGSYYTPPELVGELLRSALEPVLKERLAAAKSREAKAKAILDLKVCDPACGSGHFLLAAARRLGRELARVRTGADEPSPEEARGATREVVSHCLYGVDRNPLAVDLCRVALWLESHTADKPLTFLDHRIRPGDSLVGVFDLAILKHGIPDEAFAPLEGDDKPTARLLSKKNKEERLEGKSDMYELLEAKLEIAPLARRGQELDALPDDDAEAVRRKKTQYESDHRDPLWQRDKLACDLWTGAFFQALIPGKTAITSDALKTALNGGQVLGHVSGIAVALAQANQFFHWPLEFPEVFAKGGFDVLLSNPPWERVKLQEQEFFAARDGEIALAVNKAARTRLIKTLPERKPELHAEYTAAMRGASAVSNFLRKSNRYPLTGRGDINTYAVFAEFLTNAVNPTGRSGLILPKGIATDDTTKFYFNSIIDDRRLVDIVGFENEDFIFPAVDHRVTFCKMTLTGKERPAAKSRLAFYIRKFPQLEESHRYFEMERGDFWLLNPNTGNCPIFRSQADAELTKAIYRRVPVLWQEATETQPERNPWRLSFKTLFHMANDSHYFKESKDLEADGYRLEGSTYAGPYDRYLPLYEAKMFHQFDHRFSTYEGATEKQMNVGILPQPSLEQKRNPNFVVQPRYWVREEVVRSSIPGYPEPLAKALELGDVDSMRYVLSLWVAGHKPADDCIRNAKEHKPEKAVAKLFEDEDIDARAAALARDFPLAAEVVQRIEENLKMPEKISRELVERFRPKWFLGWRNITNTTNERSLIASIIPFSAIGHSTPLAVSSHWNKVVFLLAIWDSFIMDYCIRQKIGGTNLTYGIIRQVALLDPTIFENQKFTDWLLPRVLELVYTAKDLEPLARDYGYDGPPFVWDEVRRFKLRCEIDAAFFHAYFPCDSKGNWRAIKEERFEQLIALKNHFTKPRDAVEYVMEQFPIVKRKDEEAYGCYRTKDRILDLYDALLKEVQRD